MTHHSVMTSSLQFGDFSSDNDYNSKKDEFRHVIYLIINECEPSSPKGSSGGQCRLAAHRKQAKSACLY